MKKNMFKKILIVKSRALGDSIIGLSSLSYIKSIISNVYITYALPSWIVPLYSQVKSSADEYIPLNLSSPGDWPASFLSLKKMNFDLIVELHQSGRTGKFFRIFSLLTGIPYYFHNHHQGPKKASPGLKEFNHPAIQRDLDGLWNNLKLHLGREDLPRPHYLDFPPRIELRNKVIRNKSVILGVVATRKTKLWPLSYFSKLCRLIVEHDPDIQFLIPLSNSALDQEIEREMATLEFPAQTRILKEGLEKLPSLLSSSTLYIGNDTGLKHLSVSLGLPTLTFFGPEDPAEWHPYDKAVHPYFFVEKLECRTRISHFCPLTLCDSMICLNKTYPESVFNKLLECRMI